MLPPRFFRKIQANCVWWAAICFGASLWLGASATAAPPVPATGANVDETRVRQTLYVDPANAEAADDDKHGTAEAPFATLDYGCRTAERLKNSNQGVKLVLAAGTYRESAEIRPPADGKTDTEAPLIIEAAERDQTVLDGADAEGWSPSTWKEENGRWSHPWPSPPNGTGSKAEKRGAGGLPPAALSPAYRRGTLVVVNGTVLRAVNAAADLQPGTFCLQGETPSAPTRRGGVSRGAMREVIPRTILIQPPEDVPLAGAIIQVGKRGAGLEISGRRNVVVRGLLFQHAAFPLPPVNGGASAVGLRLVNCANVLVEDVLSQWNDDTGLELTSSRPGSERITVRRTRLLHNGGTGLAVNGVHDLLVEDSEVSFNNFHGEWADWIDAQRLAGVLAARVDGSTWRRQRVIGNHARGLWFTGAANLIVEEAVVRDNVESGVLFDACPGPTLLQRSLIGRTRGHASIRSTSADAGVAAYGSADLTLEGNLIVDNAVPAFSVADLSPAAPSPTGGGQVARGSPPPRAERHTFHHNVFYGQGAAQTLVEMPAIDRLGAEDFTRYFSTLDLRDNCFWNSTAEGVFLLYDMRGLRQPGLNFAGWMAFLVARAGGPGKASAFSAIWQDPFFVDPIEGNYRFQDDSPLQKWGLQGDEAAPAGQEQ